MVKISMEFLFIFLITILLVPESLSFGPCPEGYNGNVRNPLNCSTYYSCTSYGPELMPCQPDLCYNEDKDWCDWCWEVPACSGDDESTTEKDFMCELPSSSSSYSYPIFFQLPGDDCEKFYFCDMIGKYGGVGQCAKGLWFNFELQACIEPWSDHCHFKEMDYEF